MCQYDADGAFGGAWGNRVPPQLQGQDVGFRHHEEIYLSEFLGDFPDGYDSLTAQQKKMLRLVKENCSVVGVL